MTDLTEKFVDIYDRFNRKVMDIYDRFNRKQVTSLRTLTSSSDLFCVFSISRR